MPVRNRRLTAHRQPIETASPNVDLEYRICIGDGAVQVAVQYPQVDVEKKYDELVREMNALRPELPGELVKLEINKINPGLVNIVQYALVSEDAPYPELEEYARQLRDSFRGVTGVRTAQSWAFPARELRVALDLRRMAELGLTQSQITQALQSENASIPGGVIDIGPRSFSIKTSGSYRSLDEGAFQLGPLGERRSTGRGESDHCR